MLRNPIRIAIGIVFLFCCTLGHAQQVTFQREVSVKRVVPYSLAFSPDGRYLAVLGSTGDFDFQGTTDTTLKMQLHSTLRTLVLLDTKKYKVKRQLMQESDKGLPGFLGSRFHPMVFSADGRNLIVFHETALRVWDTEKGIFTGTWGRDFSKVAFSTDHRYALATRNDGKHELVDLQDGRSLGAFAAEQEGELVPLDAERPFLAYLKEGKICLKNLKTGEEVPVGSLGGKTLTGGAISHDGRLLAATSDSGDFGLWSLAERNRLGTRPGSGKSASSPAFSPDGSVVLFVADGKFHVCSTAGEITSFEAKHLFAIRGASFTPNSRSLASLGAMVDPMIKIWDLPAAQAR
jgi:WD40 repeat protein